MNIKKPTQNWFYWIDFVCCDTLPQRHTDRFLSCAHVLFEYLIALALPIPDQDSRSKLAGIERQASPSFDYIFTLLPFTFHFFVYLYMVVEADMGEPRTEPTKEILNMSL